MVLFVSYSGIFGGAERLLVDFAGGLRSECVVACPLGPLDIAARAAGLRTFLLRERPLELRGPAGQPLRALGELVGHGYELRRLVEAVAPEVVVAWGMRSLLAAVGAGRLGARLAFQHNDFLPGGVVGALVRAAAGRAALVTAPSQAVLDDLGRPGVVIAPGVAVERFAAAGAASTSAPEVLVLGAIAGWKRPDLALEVMARVRARIPEARLRLAGAPLAVAGADVLAALRERARRGDLEGGVEFAGHVDDPARALARCRCLLHCAEREPFGIAVLEALASGRPAIVPDAGGPAEIVDDSCGRRYRPGDAAAAANAVVAVLSDPPRADAMGAAGRRRAASAFALERQRARYADAVEALVEAPCAEAGPELALVTVTHNSAPDLEALLVSVRRHLPTARVVVADCASEDGTVAFARGQAGVTVLALANVGFGRACNRALTSITEPVTALVNPDVELIDDSLAVLAAEVLSPRRPQRLLAPLVLNTDGTRQDTVHPAPLSAADLARALVPPTALPGRLGVRLAPWRSRTPRPVGWAVGCALVARTETLRALGPFDERIFLYGEDMELGLRAAREGVATWFWPATRVIHHGGHSIEAAHGGEPFALRARARHEAVALARGPRSAALDDCAQALTFASRLALKRALGRPAGRERRQLEAVLASRRG